MEVTHNKILICLLLIKIILNFKVIVLPLKIVQLNLYLAKYVFYNETQLEGEKCKFQKLQNKDHPSTCMLFTFENGSSAHALGGVSGVASFITTDEQLQ